MVVRVVAWMFSMIRKLIRMILLKDIAKSLFVGIRSCFKKPVTRKLSEIKRVGKFRDGFAINKNKCVRCGICEGICPNNAVKLKGHEIPVFDFNKCCYCGLCQKACPKLAIKTKHLKV